MFFGIDVSYVAVTGVFEIGNAFNRPCGITDYLTADRFGKISN
jgi:hypothetical protein